MGGQRIPLTRWQKRGNVTHYNKEAHMDYDTWLSTDPAEALEAEIERRVGELEAA